MLLRFRFTNFRLFRTEQEFSMIAGPLKGSTGYVIHRAGIPEPVLTAAVLYGANGSGKTNFLRALLFMARAVEFSYTRWQPDERIPRQPFALGQDQQSPSEFSIDFLMEGVHYQYGFTVSDAAVLQEWLYAYPKGKRQAWFRRRFGESMSFSERMHGENRTIEALMRPNCLFLSAAAQNNHPALSPVYKWFSRSLKFVLGDRSGWMQDSAALCAHPRYREAIVRMLAGADLGISDLHVSEGTVPEGARQLVSALRNAMVSAFKDLKLSEVDERRKYVHLVHRFAEAAIPFEPDQESNGTIAFLALLGPILSSLETGGVAFVDELDASLHPLLAIRLIQIFGEPSQNPKNAQLIFNTHDTNLLSRGVLRRDQIWFAEKKRDGGSQIYPLTDFKPRKEENLRMATCKGDTAQSLFLNPEYLSFDPEIKHEEA